jgi:hypothetical protein
MLVDTEVAVRVHGVPSIFALINAGSSNNLRRDAEHKQTSLFSVFSVALRLCAVFFSFLV